MDLDLSAYMLYLMPIGFLTTANYATGLAVSNDERNLVNYLANLIKESHTDQGKDFNVSLDVNISFKRTSVADAAAVLRRGTGISLIEADSSAEFPTPATLATAPDRVYLGRLRSDMTRDRALNFWVVADNVRKCAAHNAVSAAQILVNSAR